MYSVIVNGIDEEIARLREARGILASVDSEMLDAVTKKKRGRPAKVKAAPEKKRALSAESRAKIAAAQKARWAKSKTN